MQIKIESIKMWNSELAQLLGIAPNNLSVYDYYQLVPWLYRAIDLRANSVADMPYRWEGKMMPWLEKINWTALKFVIEASLCLSGYAIVLIQRSFGGIPVGLEWIAPNRVTVQWQPDRPVVKWLRNGKANDEIDLNDLIIFKLPDFFVGYKPGTPPAQVAMEACGMAYYSAAYLRDYFANGAMKSVLLQVEGNPPEAEIKKLEAWWSRLADTITRAWRTAAVRASVKPLYVGYPIKDMAISQIWADARRQICAAMGVPQTLLEDAANYATAVEHRRSFYTETIIPRCRMIEAELNSQFLTRLGVRMVHEPTKLEIFQQDEMAKAQALIGLVGAGIMTISEARDWLGLAPNPTPQQLQWQIQREVNQWRKAIKQNREFDAHYMPKAMKDLIELALGAGFNPLKTAKDMDDDIATVKRKVLKILDAYKSKMAKSLQDGQIDESLLAEMQNELRKEIASQLASIVYSQIIAAALAQIPIVDAAVVNTWALNWAGAYTFDLVKGITDTTRKGLQAALSQFVSTPGMTVAELEALIAPLFGSVRAEMIATTEVTRAYSMATNGYQQFLQEHGLNATRIWHTNRDDRVCEICNPLDGKTEKEWGNEYPDGAPAHVNCRCTITLKLERG